MNKPTYFFGIFFLAFFYCILTSEASSKTSIFPQFLDEMPTYNVKIIPSPKLPQPQLQLTRRALRILPSYFIHAHIIEPYKVKIPTELNRIRLEQVGKEKYCNKDLKICWPKSIEAVGDFLIITPHVGELIYYKDTNKLGVFLWNESRQPIGTLLRKERK